MFCILVAGPKADHEEKVKPAGLASILEDVVVTKTEKSPLDQAKAEMDVYMTMDSLSLSGNPLTWWKEHEWQLPLLSRMARKYLCIPATSVPSERVFGTAGDVLAAQRATLEAENVDMLIFLENNMT